MVDSYAATQAGDASAIRVGDVLNRAFALFAASWAPFVGLSLIVFAPQFLFGLLVSGARSVGLALGGNILQIVCTSLADAAIIYGVVQKLRGRDFTVPESLGAGFGRLGAVVGLSLVVGIFAGLATLLLVVPGIVVWCMYAVAIPVCVVERVGVGASMGRSTFLTKGNRWRIFGIFALVMIAGGLIGVVLGALAAFVGGVTLAGIVGYLVESAAGAFGAVISGVLYHELRAAKEGVDIDRIAAVFD
jgi:hypothetical protein